MSKGLIIKNTGSWYYIRTDEDEDIQCKLRGTFRLKGIRTTNPLAVGDRVCFDKNQDGTGIITKIEERKNYIIRRASNLSKQAHIIAANIDTAFLVATIKDPETSTIFIDRFLASAEAYRIPACLVFNKIDIYDEDDLQYLDALTNLYSYIGYPCFRTSVKTGEGIDELKDKIASQVTLFAGHSGVGKSSIINYLIPGTKLRTSEISEYHRTGIHTTTFSEMIDLPTKGFIIDSPGIKGFGTVEMSKEEISHYFIEIFKTSKKCRFNNCLHINEPECAVINAVEKNHISRSRYNSYLNMIEEDIDEKYR